MEIERKFLVDSLPADYEAFPHVEIEQCYLCTSPTLRVRRMGDEYIMTVKEHVATRSEAIHNREEEFRLTPEAYERLRAKCEGRPVTKTRYRIPLDGGLTAELDVFHGHNEGLMLVEVEFPDTETADSFMPPSWFGTDVSKDKRYRNSYMAFHTTLETENGEQK